MKKINLSKKLLGTSLALSLTAGLAANAVSNTDIEEIFAINEVSVAGQVLGNHGDDHHCGDGHDDDHKDGDHKCGEGKCGH